MMTISNLKKFYFNKKILITGHTGFKGAWLSSFLNFMGAKIYGISLDPVSNNNIYDCIKHKLKIDLRVDITNYEKLNKTIKKLKPDIIFHLAAQPLVFESYKKPLLTFNTNLMGSLNVLNSIIKNFQKSKVVMITSDKCYQNNEWLWGYRENDILGGIDPYSASKASVEIAINSFVKSFAYKDHKIITARAGNVIGGGDWSENRIVPDIIKSWKSKKPITIRNPNSTRPWQHVLDPIYGYSLLPIFMDTKIFQNGESFNFGPDLDSEYKVIDVFKKLNEYLPELDFKIKKNQNKVHESGLLRLNCEKAKLKLKWQSNLNFNQTIRFTSEWYKFYFSSKKNKEKIADFTFKQINNFLNNLK